MDFPGLAPATCIRDRDYLLSELTPDDEATTVVENFTHV